MNALHRAIIPAYVETGPRPIWSVMIPIYNCADYLRETLQSLLIQDPGPEVMQIEVIDDYSTQDDPEAIVNTIGKGRVTFYQQPKNVVATSFPVWFEVELLALYRVKRAGSLTEESVNRKSRERHAISN